MAWGGAEGDGVGGLYRVYSGVYWRVWSRNMMLPHAGFSVHSDVQL